MHNTLTLTRNPNHACTKNGPPPHSAPSSVSGPAVFRVSGLGPGLCFVFQVLAGGCVSCFSFGQEVVFRWCFVFRPWQGPSYSCALCVRLC